MLQTYINFEMPATDYCRLIFCKNNNFISELQVVVEA